MEWKNAVKLSKMGDGKTKMVNFGLKTVMVAQIGDDFYATEGLCRHMRWPLAWGGKISDGCIRCPLHQTTHSIDDGQLIEWAPFPFFPPYGRMVGKMSKQKDLPVYETKIEGDYLQVRI